jgi:fatty-acyl-CoA synthase
MGLIERLKGDVVTLKGALRTLKMTTPIAKNPSRVFPAVIDDLAEKFGDAPALLSDREGFSYRALAERSNRYARFALAQGLAKGDAICLMMPNRPEFMAIWLGFTRAGGVVALVNTNLAGAALAYCINVVEPKHVIVAAELAGAFAIARPHLAVNAKVWLHGADGADLPRIDQEIDAFPGATLAASERRALTIEDRALYIYTSGTTGMPKAANINHYRLMLASHGFAGIMDTKASDRLYDCLPMYHTVGGVVATGAMLINGGATVIREKFSAREFWDDVTRWDCTVFQYIGELCRYLVNSAPHPKETAHRLRLACGNGLRPDVWPHFQERFRIPHILEFYAATEGNVSMFNFESKQGAVGRIPWFLAHRFPTKLIKFDVETERSVRTPEGLCVACAPNEVGEAVGKILKDPSRPGSRFEGYASEAETEKKILRDVFEKGDAWFRTGDLMRQDEDGYFYFIDRVGDTFRWKGENVATSEVSETMTAFPGVTQANVYGVAVAGRDGRAGMAALVVEPGFEFAAFRAYLCAHLPEYARPLFLRLLPELDITATFKQKKFDLVRDGFDPGRIKDPLYFNDAERGAFVPLDAALCTRIQSGSVRM